MVIILNLKQTYVKNVELHANANSANNVPLCFFCTELSASIKKVEIFKILSFEFVLKLIMT